MRFALLALVTLVACAASPIPPGPVPRPALTPALPTTEVVAVPAGYRPIWVLADCPVREVLHVDLKLDGQVLPGETLGFLVLCPAKLKARGPY